MRMRKCKRKSVNASLTVEAAFVFPIFIFAIATILYLFQWIYIQQSIQYALHQTVAYVTRNAYLIEQLYEDENTGEIDQQKITLEELGLQFNVSNLIYKEILLKFLDERVLHMSLLLNGEDGLHVKIQGEYFDEDVLDLSVYYECQIPFVWFAQNSFPCIQRVRGRKWIGKEVKRRDKIEDTKDQDETDEQVVYITKTGKKYHLFMECTHLSLSIQNTSMQKVESERNNGGGKYNPCQICIKGHDVPLTSILYITSDGERYHISKQCSGLKRTVESIPMSDVSSDMTCCKRCEKNSEKGLTK